MINCGFLLLVKTLNMWTIAIVFGIIIIAVVCVCIISIPRKKKNSEEVEVIKDKVIEDKFHDLKAKKDPSDITPVLSKSKVNISKTGAIKEEEIDGLSKPKDRVKNIDDKKLSEKKVTGSNDKEDRSLEEKADYNKNDAQSKEVKKEKANAVKEKTNSNDYNTKKIEDTNNIKSDNTKLDKKDESSSDENVNSIIDNGSIKGDLESTSVNGKYIIKKDKDKYKFALLDDEGKSLYDSDTYTSPAGCKTAIHTFKKNVEKSEFETQQTDKDNYRYILNKARGSYQSNTYQSKEEADKAIELVKKYALSDIIESE